MVRIGSNSNNSNRKVLDDCSSSDGTTTSTNTATSATDKSTGTTSMTDTDVSRRSSSSTTSVVVVSSSSSSSLHNENKLQISPLPIFDADPRRSPSYDDDDDDDDRGQIHNSNGNSKDRNRNRKNNYDDDHYDREEEDHDDRRKNFPSSSPTSTTTSILQLPSSTLFSSYISRELFPSTVVDVDDDDHSHYHGSGTTATTTRILERRRRRKTTNGNSNGRSPRLETSSSSSSSPPPPPTATATTANVGVLHPPTADRRNNNRKKKTTKTKPIELRRGVVGTTSTSTSKSAAAMSITKKKKKKKRTTTTTLSSILITMMIVICILSLWSVHESTRVGDYYNSYYNDNGNLFDRSSSSMTATTTSPITYLNSHRHAWRRYIREWQHSGGGSGGSDRGSSPQTPSSSSSSSPLSSIVSGVDCQSGSTNSTSRRFRPRPPPPPVGGKSDNRLAQRFMKGVSGGRSAEVYNRMIEKNPLKQKELVPICFVTSQYAEQASQTDKLMNLIEDAPDLYERFGKYTKFYAFTNLGPDDVDYNEWAPGWNVIQMTTFDGYDNDHDDGSDVSMRDGDGKKRTYSRTITQSRWAKFQGYKHPTINGNCRVVFYMDGIYRPLNTGFAIFQEEAKRVIESDVGLSQVRHKRLEYGPDFEFLHILDQGKDNIDNIIKSLQWLHSRPDYNPDCTMYQNSYFAYDVQNARFRQAAEFFWSRYSLEEDSWRDQPLWCYTLSHFDITPLNFPVYDLSILADKKNILRKDVDATGWNDHQYYKTASMVSPAKDPNNADFSKSKPRPAIGNRPPRVSSQSFAGEGGAKTMDEKERQELILKRALAERRRERRMKNKNLYFSDARLNTSGVTGPRVGSETDIQAKLRKSREQDQFKRWQYGKVRRVG